MLVPSRLLATIAVLLLVFNSVQVDAHGFMATPRSRGAYCNDKVGPNVPIPQGCTEAAKDNCAHCQNGGGVGKVRENLNQRYSRYRSDNRMHAGLCGDELGNADHMIGGMYVPFDKAPIVAGYEPGSVVDFAVQIDTNHNGYFSFYLCNLDACGTDDIEQKCFRNHCQQLERVPTAQCENPGEAQNYECGPIDKDQPGRWYVPCRGRGKVKGGGKGTMKYRIPSNVNCKHCVVQMYWVTANSCNPTNIKKYFQSKPFGSSCGGDGGSVGGINPTLRDCGGGVFPEEFWGCADVAVHSGASKKTLAQLQLDGSPGDDSPNGSDSLPVAAAEDISGSDDTNLQGQNQQNQNQADDRRNNNNEQKDDKPEAQAQVQAQAKAQARKEEEEKKAEAQQRAEGKKKAEAQKRAEEKKRADARKRAEERKKAQHRAAQKAKANARNKQNKSKQPKARSQNKKKNQSKKKSENNASKNKNRKSRKVHNRRKKYKRFRGRKVLYKVVWVRGRNGRRYRKVIYYRYRRGRFVKQKSYS